jgi:hypothetical protein
MALAAAVRRSRTFVVGVLECMLNAAGGLAALCSSAYNRSVQLMIGAGRFGGR